MRMGRNWNFGSLLVGKENSVAAGEKSMDSPSKTSKITVIPLQGECPNELKARI